MSILGKPISRKTLKFIHENISFEMCVLEVMNLPACCHNIISFLTPLRWVFVIHQHLIIVLRYPRIIFISFLLLKTYVFAVYLASARRGGEHAEGTTTTRGI